MKNTKKIGFIKFLIFYFKATQYDVPPEMPGQEKPPKIHVPCRISLDKKFRKQLMLFAYPFVCLFQLLCFIYCCNFFHFQELFQFSPVMHVSVFIAPFILEITWLMCINISLPQVFIIWIFTGRKITNITYWIIVDRIPCEAKGILKELTDIKKNTLGTQKYFAQNNLIKIDDNISISSFISGLIPFLFMTSSTTMGFINDKPVKIKFKGKNVKIYFKDEVTVIKDTFNSPDELLNAVIEKLTQLKELDLIENPPLPPQNNSNKRKNKGKKKRK